MTRAELLAIAKPILFNTAMVRAIDEGRKGATRRAIKLYLGLADTDKNDSGYLAIPDEYGDYHDANDLCRYKPGNILYVRETWAKIGGHYFYKTGHKLLLDGEPLIKRWHPSIHMPKEAARIFLRVTDVRVERLRNMTADDVEREGLTDLMDEIHALDLFAELWNSTIKKKDLDRYGWAANPGVWVIEFGRVKI